MVTAMTPTTAGEGKTTTAIGLADALRRLGKKAAVALREPSLGPVFGLKGGATGGGRAQVAPADDINLHFTGDMHAITSAHNLLAAMVDNRLHFDGSCGPLDARNVTWKRVMDMDDRVLRDIIVGVGEPLKGVARETGFDITAASEVMAIFCLAVEPPGPEGPARRASISATRPDGRPGFARDIKAAGAMTALLKDAINPNLVQTLEGHARPHPRRAVRQYRPRHELRHRDAPRASSSSTTSSRRRASPRTSERRSSSTSSSGRAISLRRPPASSWPRSAP